MFDLQGLHLVLRGIFILITIPIAWIFIRHIIKYMRIKDLIPPSNKLIIYHRRQATTSGLLLLVFLIMNMVSFLKLSPQSDAKRTTMRHGFDTSVYQSDEPFITVRPEKYTPNHKKAKAIWDAQRNAAGQ